MYSADNTVMTDVFVRTGTIIKAVSGFYYVDCGDRVIQCKARGNFRHTKVSPIVGDTVNISAAGGDTGIVENVLPRKNSLSRPVVANIDKIIIVSSYENPAPDTYLIDRMTAISVFNRIDPIIVFNKADLGDFEKISDIYKNAGFNTYTVSASHTDTLSALKQEFYGSVCAMAGNSGVGKTSLINALFGDMNLKTGEISTALGRGRHTTRHTQMFKNDLGGYVIDTPGFSSVFNAENVMEFKENLVDCFPDFVPHKDCRYTTCTHTCEAGCGILQAIENGDIEKTRHNSYVALFNELKDVNKWKLNKG